jgi:hypothetical protein
MTRPAPDVEDSAGLLALGHAARVLAREVSAKIRAEPSSERQPSWGELIAYAGRTPGDAVDAAVGQRLRRDPSGAARYRRVLTGLAIAYSPLALAAFSPGVAIERRIGEYMLTVVDDAEDAAPALVLTAAQGDRWPGSIEAHHGMESVRVALPPPGSAGIMILLDPGIPETALLGRLIREPDCELYLV